MALAERQHGVISAAQLSRNGLSGRSAQKRVTSGRLRRIYRGVYAVSGAPLSRDGSRMAAVLAGGEGALLARENGGALWGFTRPDPFPRHILLPGSGRKGPPGVRIHRTRHLDPRDRAEVRGIPVTSVALTLVDLAETLSDQQLARAVHEAEVLRLFDKREFDRFNGRRGAHLLLTLLADPEATISQGEFDDRFLKLCRTQHLPFHRCTSTCPPEAGSSKSTPSGRSRESVWNSTAPTCTSHARLSAATARGTLPWRQRAT